MSTEVGVLGMARDPSGAPWLQHQQTGMYNPYDSASHAQRFYQNHHASVQYPEHQHPSLFPRFGSCELQDPVWGGKMNAAPPATGKKRKKADAKAQSQIIPSGANSIQSLEGQVSQTPEKSRKCVIEQKRRSLENGFIDELSELISASLEGNYASVKPDKSAVLQETVNQIRQIKQNSGLCGGAVQQGEVSSSRQNFVSSEVIEKLLLEAWEGFLFIVNSDCTVEYVTENVSQFLKCSPDDVQGESIYKLIHSDDHSRLTSTLLPNWTSDRCMTPRHWNFSCRFLVKNPDDEHDIMGEKQRGIKYEIMQISSRLLPCPKEKCESGDVTSESAEFGPLVMCVARRVPRECLPPGEQFTMRLDTTGKIVAVDTSSLSSNYSHHVSKQELVGKSIQDFCHPMDIARLKLHFQDTVASGLSTNKTQYRFRSTSSTTSKPVVLVQVQSKYYKSPDSDFVMSLHTILGDEPAESNHGNSSNMLTNSVAHSPHSVLSLGQSSSGSPSSNHGNNSVPVGGPLMANINGQLQSGQGRGLGGTPASASGNDVPTSTPNSYVPTSEASTPYNSFSENFLHDLFPTSTSWDMDGSADNCSDRTQHAWGDRPDSRQSLTPGSTPTPRPSSVPACPSPLNTPFSGTQASPAAHTPVSMVNPFSGNYSFSPVHEDSKDSKDGAMDSAMAGDSGRLRDLLTKRTSTGGEDGETPDSDAEGHKILKKLLKQDDEDDRRPDGRSSPSGRPGVSGRRSQGSADLPKNKGSNDMLLKLLNDNNDDDELEQRAGIKKQGELLQQLLKEQDEERKSIQDPQSANRHPDQLLNSLGFQSVASPSQSAQPTMIGGVRKRPSDDGDSDYHNSVLPKRPTPVPAVPEHVTSSGPSVATNPSTVPGPGPGPGPGPSPGSGPGPGPNPAGPVASAGSGPRSAGAASGSRLCEQNKMLASLLAKQPSQTAIPPIPASVISATPQEKLPRVLDRAKPNTGAWTGGCLQTTPSSTPSTVPTVATGRSPACPSGTDVRNQRPGQPRPGQPGAAGPYPNQMMTQDEQMHNHHPHHPNHHQMAKAQLQSQQQQAFRDYRQNSVALGQHQAVEPDLALSDILDQVIDIVPESGAQANILNLMEPLDAPTTSGSVYPGSMSMNETMAINAIQKSLMQCETAVKSPSSPNVTPPAYSTATSQASGFPPPYQRTRMNMAQPRSVASPMMAGSQMSHGVNMNQTTVNAMQQRAKLLQQKQAQQAQQERSRLLQQQQQQQVLMSSNATSEQMPSLTNFDSLLNNTVAPNVTLQRSSSLPDSQLSPSYGNPMIGGAGTAGAQISPGQRLSQPPYSPHSQMASPIQQAQNQGFNPGMSNFVGNPQQQTLNQQQQVAGQARLSPHPPNSLASFQQSQMSPRITQVQQPGYPPMSQSGYPGARGFVNQNRQVQQQHQQQQQQGAPMGPIRSLPSPGVPGNTGSTGPTRQSPFPQEGYPPPSSPTSYQTYQMRHSRAMNTQNPGNQLTGSSWHYGQKELLPEMHHPPMHPTHHSFMYHNPSQPTPTPAPAPDHFCYDQATLQMYGASERGRPPAPLPPAGGTLNNNMTSDYVKQELRATVGARMQQQSAPTGVPGVPPGNPAGPGQGAGPGGNRLQPTPQHLQQLMSGQVQQTELSAMGLSFEMTSGCDASKNWLGTDIAGGSPQPSLNRNNMDDVSRPGGDQKSSLLQKLLSE